MEDIYWRDVDEEMPEDGEEIYVVSFKYHMGGRTALPVIKTYYDKTKFQNGFARGVGDWIRPKYWMPYVETDELPDYEQS